MDNIRLLRRKKNISMKELGKIVGVAESTISLYETEKREPDISTLIKLAKYFGVTIDYILGASDAPFGEKGDYYIELAPESSDEREVLAMYREIKKRGNNEAVQMFFNSLKLMLDMKDEE